MLKNCTSTRGDHSCLEVQFIFSRMGTGLPEDIDNLIKYDETTKPNAWYEAKSLGAKQCYKALLPSSLLDDSSEIFKLLSRKPSIWKDIYLKEHSTLRTLVDNGCGMLAWDNTLTDQENITKQQNSLIASFG